MSICVALFYCGKFGGGQWNTDRHYTSCYSIYLHWFSCDCMTYQAVLQFEPQWCPLSLEYVPAVPGISVIVVKNGSIPHTVSIDFPIFFLQVSDYILNII